MSPPPPVAAAREASPEARPWTLERAPRSVLAIRLHALGDTVLTLPYLAAVRRRWPDARLDFLTRAEVADIPRAVVLFDGVHALGGGRDRRRIALAAAARLPGLAARRYEVVLDLQGNRLTRVLRSVMRPRAWSVFDRLSPRLAGERTRRTIEAAGTGPLEVWTGLPLRDAGRGPERLREAGWNGSDPLVVLNPAGLTPGRRWPLDAWTTFAERWLTDAPTTRLVVLGLDGMALVASTLAERLGPRLLNLVGRTTAAEAFEILGSSELVLSEDSGLLHMAWVAGAPTLGLFGASRATWARPHGSRAAYAGACLLEDGACIDGECRRGDPPCLARLDPGEVVPCARALRERAAGDAGALHVDGRSHAPPLAPPGSLSCV